MTPRQARIYGLVGYPVRHSLSALMHNAAFRALKINAEYRLFEVEPLKLEAFLLDNIKVWDTQGEAFCSQDIIGFNITIPHKIKAREILEKKFPLSFGKLVQQDQYYVKLSGAINTAKRENGQILYWNTDAWGFSKALQEDLKFDAKNKKVFVVGCGGSGRAVIASLSWKGLCREIYVYDKVPAALNSAQEHFFGGTLSQDWVDLLMEKLKFIREEKIPETVEKCDLLVNASPVGMESDRDSVISRDLLEKNKNLFVYDVVYNRQTQLLKDAASLGLPAKEGSGMLLYQGAAAFELWTRRKAPVEVMREKINEGVGKIC